MVNYIVKSDTLAAWMTFGRGLFATALGLALILWPDAARPFLANFIGAFWLSGGLLSIRWGLHTQHSKMLTILVGLIGIVAGASVMGRTLVSQWVNPSFVVVMLGVVALLTGLLHVSGRMTVRHAPVGDLSRTGVLLGIIEIMLGLTLLFGSIYSGIAYMVSIAWALLGGIALFNDARLMRQETLSAGRI